MDTIPGVFAHSVAQFSKRVALIEPREASGTCVLTYRDLQQRVRSFAGYLQAAGLQQGERVLLWSASCIDWMVAFLAVQTVGGVVVPLDVHSTETFLRQLAQTTEAKYLVATGQLFATLGNSPVPWIDLEALPGGTFDEAKLPVIGPDDLAMLVFTSGTTGQPKGVMLSQRNIVSDARGALSLVEVTPGDRALSILPLSHMYELTIETALLMSGASVVYARSLVPDTLLRLLGTQRITCMVLVPQALQLFRAGIERQVRLQKKERQWQLLHRLAVHLPFRLRPLLFASVHRRFGGQFRFFISGGAYLSPQLARYWEEMGIRVLQGYGTTECCSVVTGTPYREHTFESVGKPVAGVEIRLAEDGEILVAGPIVAAGYWKNPEASATTFRDGWCYTGDLGSLDEAGRLYLKGRKSNRIVLANGMNVYPEDLENVLLTMPAIKDAVVVGLMRADQGPVVHAVLLAEDPTEARAVIGQANRQLAPHQQIRSFSIWPTKEFPRTHTLKVKRSEVLEAVQTNRQQEQ